MEEERKKVLHELPIELLGMVFEFIPVKDLSPCFLISKHCFKAVCDEVIWKARCMNDLGIVAKNEETKTWLQLYKGKP